MTTHFRILHPVRTGDDKHRRGAVVPASTFSETDTANLLAAGAIAPTAAAVRPAPVLTPTTLAKLNLAELLIYAGTHGLTLKAGLSKDEILSELSQAATAAVDMNDANARAAEHGR